ncbi:MAG: nucleotidyltransferase family protein [Thermodesulfobacteriota bacterium]
MKTKEEILGILKNEFSYLNNKYSVKKLGLFGSYSRGEQTPKSDIDLLVEFENPIGFFKYIELEDYLSEKIGAKVELVTDDALKPIVRPYVMENIIYVQET